MTQRTSIQEVHEQRSTVGRRVISPAQMVAGGIGLFLVVLGGVALARAGLDSLIGDPVGVLWFEHTALMALLDVVAGLLFLGAAASTGGRSTLIGLSLLTMAFGAVVAIEPGSFDETLGGGVELGALYLALGTIGLAVALLFPTRVVERVATVEAADRID